MNGTCLSNRQLECFASGEATPEEIESCCDHLESCESCQHRFSSLCESTSDKHASSSVRDNLSPGDEALLSRIAANTGMLEATLVKAEVKIPGFEIESLQGEGGQARVYRARQAKLDNRIVALKVLGLGAFPVHKSDLARFSVEAQAYCKLEHTNIVRLYDVGEYKGYPYHVLEFVEGGTLRQFLDVNRLSPKRAAELVKSLCLAVQHAHERGILHRDLKPNNIFLTTEGVCKVGDFGLARFTESETGITHSSQPIGTKEYASPEQAQGKHSQVCPASDVYSLGAILYEILVGRPPFLAHDWSDLVAQIKAADPVSPRSLRNGVPRELETICLKCLKKTPKDRYLSAAALAEDLDAFLNARPIAARSPGIIERAIKFCRRNVAVVVIVTASLLVSFLTIVMAIREVRFYHANSESLQKENELQLQLIRSEIQQGRQLAEDGKWNQAIEKFQIATNAVSEQQGLAQIELARVYYQRGNNEQASKTLKVAEESLGETGQIALLKASIEEARNPEASVAAAKRALDKPDLSEADKAFASALIAPTLDKTIAHLEETLRLTPGHLQAGRMYVCLMLLTGRFAEAEKQVEKMKTILPRDQCYVIVEAMHHAANGQREEAQVAVDRGADQFDTDTVVALKKLIDIIAQAQQRVDSLPQTVSPDQAIAILGEVWNNYTQIRQLQSKHQVGIAMPPGLREAYSGTFANIVSSGPTIVIESLFDRKAAMTKQLRPLAKVHPDGFTLNLLGCSVLAEGKFGEAQEIFEDAYHHTSFIDLKKDNCYLALRCMWQRYRFEPMPDSTKVELRTKVGEYAYNVLAFPELNSEQLFTIGQMAFQTSNSGLSRVVAARWLALEKNNAAPHLYLAYADYAEKKWYSLLQNIIAAENVTEIPPYFANERIDFKKELVALREIAESEIKKFEAQQKAAKPEAPINPAPAP